jgi:hypothetical protein
VTFARAPKVVSFTYIVSPNLTKSLPSTPHRASHQLLAPSFALLEHVDRNRIISLDTILLVHTMSGTTDRAQTDIEVAEVTAALDTIHVHGTTFHKFLDLPREICDLIYEQYLKLEPEVSGSQMGGWPELVLERDFGCRDFCPNWVPNIFGTSHQMRSEVAETLFTRGYITIRSRTDARYLAKFLGTLKLRIRSAWCDVSIWIDSPSQYVAMTHTWTLCLAALDCRSCR